MRVAIGQMQVDWEGRKSHLHRAEAMVREASRESADWILLPKRWYGGVPSEEMTAFADASEDLLSEMKRWAGRWGIGLVGSLLEKASQGIYDSAYVLLPDGRLDAIYRKIHLSQGDEEQDVKPGDHPLTFHSGGAGIGVMLSDDVKYPELARHMAVRGAHMIWTLADWSASFLPHWRALIRTRAIENQIFMLGANACDPDDPAGLCGNSLAVNPSGEIITQAGAEQALLLVDVNLEDVEYARGGSPMIDKRRSDLYGFTGEGGRCMKVMMLEEAVSFAKRTKNDGRTIVFTNGCFDLLHAGHVSYLEQARTLGDALVVGINSDASVRSNKGPARPVVPLAERAEVLAGLSCVDVLVPFDEPDPHRLIDLLKPDILVKGADWREEEIVGADLVKSSGGRVVRIPVREGISTSIIVQRVCNAYDSTGE